MIVAEGSRGKSDGRQEWLMWIRLPKHYSHFNRMGSVSATVWNTDRQFYHLLMIATEDFPSGQSGPRSNTLEPPFLSSKFNPRVKESQDIFAAHGRGVKQEPWLILSVAGFDPIWGEFAWNHPIAIQT